MRNIKRQFVRYTTLSLAVSGVVHGTWAQAQANSSYAIEEVVVTATKRETSVQDTAIAMSVFTGDALDDNGVSQVEDLAGIAPGVTFTKNSANVVVSIRGVNSQDTNETGNPAVAIAQDGFYIERANSFSNALYDMERVEVLRGPQGTLYGKNATGGVINFITEKPVPEFEAEVSAGFGNYDTFNTEGMINLPLSNKVNARASFMTREHDGYREDEGPADAGDDADMKSGRFHLDYQPTERLYLLFSAQFTELGGVGPTVTGTPVEAWTDNAVPRMDKGGVSHGKPNQYLDHNYQTYQVTAKYDFDNVSVNYIGGVRRSDYRQRRDLDGLFRSDNYFDLSEDVKDISHELRIASSDSSDFQWQLGGNYFKETNALTSIFRDYTDTAIPVDLMVFDFDVESESTAVFVHTSYDFSDVLTFELGARYSEDELSRRGNQLVFGTPSVYDNSGDNSKSTYHVGANWNISDDVMAYAKFSTGYKAGGFNNVPGRAESNPYGPETLEAFEAGVKGQYLDGRIQMNIAAFRYDYSDQQASVRNADGLSSIVNAGESEIVGLEFDWTALITPLDRFDGSVVFLDAEYTDFCAQYIAGGKCLVDFAGNSPTQTPDTSVGIGYEHDFEFTRGVLTARIQSHYETESYLGVANLGFQEKDEFTRTDILLTYQSNNSDWTLQGYARNLEDDVVITSAGKSGLWRSYTYGLSTPLTYGIKLTYRWL
ncbi:TonB-dependent receptor [Parahaliea mediterranea]|uniref:TonB-dependent receptor n=1 Tax=Parahaliea mediterranea TaxID=651086 RepID=UPI001300B39D|nr:TonB-dependent receptor [Parahaliea mediterranea]